MGVDDASPYEEARRWAEHWCQLWFLDDTGADRLRIADVEAGWATHAEVYYLLHRLALRLMGEPGRPMPLKDRLRAVGLDRSVRNTALWALAARRTDHRPVDVLALLEIPTPSMMDGVVAVVGELGVRARIVAGDPRVHLRCRRAGLPSEALQAAFSERRSAGSGDAAVQNAFDRIERDPPPMLLRGRDVTRQALEVIGPFVKRSLPWLVAETAALARAIDRARPSSMVLASDQHRLGRVATQLARGRGIRTIVVQHGLPQMRIGLVPAVADHIAVWSISSRKWFVEHGTPPERLTVTGNPRWARAFEASGAVRSATVILALSPTSVGVNARVVQLAIEAIRISETNSSLIIKLHPGHRDWGWVRKLVREVPFVRIIRNEPIEPLLAQAAATVVLRSTVAMDALAAGTPVILIRVDGGLSAADAELRETRLPTADDPSDLAKEIRALLKPTGRRAYFAKHAQTIERLIGPRDAARRIGELALP